LYFFSLFSAALFHLGCKYLCLELVAFFSFTLPLTDRTHFSHPAPHNFFTALQPEGLEFLTNRPPWKCNLCNVNCTSRDTLISHAAGTKHVRRARAAQRGKEGEGNGDGKKEEEKEEEEEEAGGTGREEKEKEEKEKEKGKGKKKGGKGDSGSGCDSDDDEEADGGKKVRRGGRSGLPLCPAPFSFCFVLH
jgi:hypothetical protein